MKLFGLIGSLFFAHLLGAQNLVPNSSFEDSDSCPQYNGDLFCTPWFNPTSSSPDYFNPCWNGWWLDTMDVPVNLAGYQWPHSGLAYAGFGSIISQDNHEYISIKLSDTLTAGSTYCLEYYVSLAEDSWGGSNKLGGHFSATPDTSYTPFTLTHLPFQPQVEFDTVIVDTSGWVKLNGTFVAVGNECYLTIGIFQPDSLIEYDSIQGNGSGKYSYYYIDDVSVVECPPPDTPVYSEIILYPNPNNGNFTLVGNFPFGAELKIYNILGQQVSRTIPLPEGNNSISFLALLAQGTYIARIEAQGTVVKSMKIVVTE